MLYRSNMGIKTLLRSIKKPIKVKELFVSLLMDAIFFATIVVIGILFVVWAKNVLNPIAQSGLPVSIDDYATALKVQGDLQGVVVVLLSFAILGPLLIFFSYSFTRYVLWRQYIVVKRGFWSFCGYQVLWALLTFMFGYYIISPMQSFMSLNAFYTWLIIAALALCWWLYLTFYLNFSILSGKSMWQALVNSFKNLGNVWALGVFVVLLFFLIRFVTGILPYSVGVVAFPISALIWLTYSRWLLLQSSS